jgi:hypothetical protein
VAALFQEEFRIALAQAGVRTPEEARAGGRAASS